DLVLAVEGSKADRRAFHSGNQCQFTGELLAKCDDIIGGGGPGLLLCLGIIISRKLLDAVSEDFSQLRGVRRQKRPQSEFGMGGCRHRAISQVVPSLESFRTIPIAASSSRIRSDSLKFLAARAAALASIKLATLPSSMETEAGRKS